MFTFSRKDLTAKGFSAEQLTAIDEIAYRYDSVPHWLTPSLSSQEIVMIADGEEENINLLPLIEHGVTIDVLDVVLEFNHDANLDLRDYAMEGYTAEQMVVIGYGLEKCLEVEDFFVANDLVESMARVLYLAYGLDYEKYKTYDIERLHVVIRGVKHNVPVDYFDRPDLYSSKQMNQIVSGYKRGVDVRPYVINDLSGKQLRYIIKGLKAGIDIESLAKPGLTDEEVKSIYNRVYSEKYPPRDTLLENTRSRVELDAKQMHLLVESSAILINSVSFHDIESMLVDSEWNHMLLNSIKSKYKKFGVKGAVEFFISLYRALLKNVDVDSLIRRINPSIKPKDLCNELYCTIVPLKYVLNKCMHGSEGEAKAAREFLSDYAKFKNMTFEKVLELARL